MNKGIFLAVLILMCATNFICAQKNYIRKIFLKNMKKDSIAVDLCNFWYFSKKFTTDTMLCQYTKQATAYSFTSFSYGKQRYAPVNFTGYIDIVYDSYSHANECYNRFIKLFIEKIIDKQKGVDSYKDMFSVFGSSICLYKAKPMIRIMRYSTMYEKNFSNLFLPLLREEYQFAKIFYIPGIHYGSEGTFEIIPSKPSIVKKK